MNEKHFLLVFLLFLTINLLQASYKPEKVDSFFLRNGIKVILYVDSNLAQVAYYTFLCVDSRNEHSGLTGVSHLIEHMIFNGTDRLGPGEFDRIREEAGGANNAYSGQDFTSYTDWFPPQALEKMVELEADRGQGLIFKEDILESERAVIVSERRLS